MCREAIPAAVKRQLRQESGFGCCHCGHPFIQFHHIIPYAEDPHMRPEDMMAVCGQCHYLLTVGAISETEQRNWKSRPKNVVDNCVLGTLYVTTEKLRVQFGSGLAVNTPSLLSIDENQDIVRIERSDDNRILVSAYIQDDNGDCVGIINKNEWQAVPEKIWDFETFPKRAIVRSAPRKISFEVDCRGEDIFLRGEWYFGGLRVSFSPSQCLVGGASLIGSHVEDCGGFLHVETNKLTTP